MDFWLWSENAAAWELFLACATQWRYGLNGVTGLDYSALVPVMAVHEIPASEQRDTLDRVRLLERGVLSAIAESRDKTHKR